MSSSTASDYSNPQAIDIRWKTEAIRSLQALFWPESLAPGRKLLLRRSCAGGMNPREADGLGGMYGSR